MNRLSPEVERRRRLVTRTLPLAVIAVIAFIVGAVVGAPGSPEKDAAERFTQAWAEGRFAAMYKELSSASRRTISVNDFAIAYREAERVATLRALDPDSGGDLETDGEDGRTVVLVPIEVNTVAFGEDEELLSLPFVDGGIAWSPSRVYPGLRPGEHLQGQIELAPRAAILAGDGSVLAEGPAEAREHPLGSAAIDVTGEVGAPSEGELEKLAQQGFGPGTPVGVSGLERAFNARLAGKPGGELLAVGSDGESRVLAASKPRPGAPVKTTIDPDLQEAAVAGLAGRAGGVAVLDARNGDVRALAGQAFSAPQPPGSTFKIVTTTAALEEGEVSLDDEFEITNGVTVGRFIENANGEYCGGTFRQAFAESCNAVFVPLGPAVGNDKLVEAAERYGFNSPPTLYAPKVVRAVEPPESTIPEEIGEETDLGVTAIGQGEVLATPLQMASVAQTVGNAGVRMPTSVVANRKLRPHAEPVRVISEKLAGELTELMTGVVTEGTGTAGAIAEAQVAGKTGTAELGPEPGHEDEEHPPQIKDAWFAAFAPAEKARLAVGVMLIDAGAAGGEVAAPIASAVLSAGL